MPPPTTAFRTSRCWNFTSAASNWCLARTRTCAWNRTEGVGQKCLRLACENAYVHGLLGVRLYLRVRSLVACARYRRTFLFFSQPKPRKSILPHVGRRWRNGFWGAPGLRQSFRLPEMQPKPRKSILPHVGRRWQNGFWGRRDCDNRLVCRKCLLFAAKTRTLCHLLLRLPARAFAGDDGAYAGASAG